jgi:uroporphyrinogen decarboxylase
VGIWGEEIMMTAMTHRERITAALRGEKTDRRPVTFWRHFFHKEHHAEGTIDAMSAWQKRFDWDLMKINPRADYHVQDWGVEIAYSHKEFEKHRKVSFPVQTIDDWKKIEPLPLSAPNLAEQIVVVSELRKRFGPDLPILMTVFTPLAIAGRLVPDETLLRDHLREDAGKVRPALEAITATFARFARELRVAGADGLFFATTSWASANMITWEEYMLFGVPYDLQVVKATGDGAINLFHVCGARNFLRQLSTIEYNCQIYNWDSADPTNSPVDTAGKLMNDRAILGGIDHNGWLLHSDADEIRLHMPGVLTRLPHNIIVGPGCAIAPEMPYDNLQAVKDSL